MSKRLFTLMFCGVLFFAGICGAAEMRKGPYLIYPGDNTAMTVLWQLYSSQTCTLEWGSDTSYELGDVNSSEYGDDHQHKFTISGLTPGEKYYYRVLVEGEEHSGSFVAAPAEDATSVKFLAYGDTRTYPEDHNKVAAEMVATFLDDPNYQTFTLLAGDWVQTGKDEEDWDEQFFDPIYVDCHKMQANLPINGCGGNHDMGKKVYKKYLPYPYVEGLYWSFDYGPAQIIVIDQYTKSYDANSIQLGWIENELEESTKEWKFLHFHEPGYSAGGHTCDEDDDMVRELIQPLCEKYGVDIVFAGHNHYYARCEVNDVTHITTGGGGAPLREPDPNYSEYVVSCASALHFCKIDINGGELSAEVVDASGEVIDSFVLVHEPE
ncbi:MAG: metallophosphoesterase family protein [Planctomycetota bacterium]|nr:MAG: metallophosphoesterase family protein [Planctomycetota bacterium]